ncbi:MAG: hypothetical protein ACLFNW_04320 [Desulfobacterales bacterium]
MKQKYTIVKDDKTGDLAIQEFAELSKDMFSLVCEESYEKDKIQSALKQGRKSLVEMLRTPNLYPISDYIEKIADAVIDLYQNGKQSGLVEMVFDDVDLFKTEEEKAEAAEEEDSVEIEDLLEDDSKDDDSKDNDSKDEEK